MKRLLLLLCLAFGLLSTTSYAFETPAIINKFKVNYGIDNILKNFGDEAHAGIIVQDLQSGQILYSKNTTHYFTPASNLKLFTAFAALNFLGSDFVFHTTVFADPKKINNGVYTGNLYFKFEGDPEFTSEQLDNLIKTIKKIGINTIRGNIILDNSSYDMQRLGPGWMWDDQVYCYGSSLDAMTVDQNCFHAQALPSSRVGEKVQLQITSQPLFATITNQITTQPSSTHCSITAKADNKNNYLLTGCVAADNTNEEINLAYYNYEQYTDNLFRYLLAKNNIKLSQKIIYGTVPNNHLIAIAKQQSKPLSQLVTDMLKESDNLVANSLYKKIGERYTHTAGTWENGTAAMQSILSEKLNLSDKDIKIVDGDGASRYNLVTPQQIAKLLVNVYHNPKISHTFIEGLPIAGVDGTLKDRMTTPDIQNKVRAKTGTMTGVSALSGYLQTNKQQQLIIVIMFNDFVRSIKDYRGLEDSICQFLVNQF